MATVNWTGNRTFTAGEDLLEDRLVKLTGDYLVEYAGAGEEFVGVALDTVAAGKPLAVALRGSARTMQCVAAAPIAQNAVIYAASEGRVSSTAVGDPIGRALQAAAAEGSRLEVVLRDVSPVLANPYTPAGGLLTIVGDLAAETLVGDELMVAGELLTGSGFAGLVGYDNAVSGLTAEDVQAALDELAAGQVAGDAFSTVAVPAGTNPVAVGASTLTLVAGSGVSITGDATADSVTIASTVTAPSAGNPTATVGGSAVNGSADTFMRSDAAPALADPFTPADGTWNVTGGIEVSGALGVGGDATVAGSLTVAGEFLRVLDEIQFTSASPFVPLLRPTGTTKLAVRFAANAVNEFAVENATNGNNSAADITVSAPGSKLYLRASASTRTGTFLGIPRAGLVQIYADGPGAWGNLTANPIYFGTNDAIALTLDGTTQRATAHAGLTSGASVRVPVPISTFREGGAGPSFEAATSGPRWVLGSGGVVYASLPTLPGAVVTGFRVSWSAAADPSEIAVALCRAAFGSTTRTVVASASVSDNTGTWDDALAITAHTIAEGYAYWLEVSQVGAGSVTLRGCDLVTSSRDY